MGLGPFRSPLLRTSRLISLPPGTEMFQFPGFASHLRGMTGLAPSRVAPFGHLGITACVPLPRASRSLPRPSSPPCAQAFPTCLHSLDSNSFSYQIRAIYTSETIQKRIASLRCLDSFRMRVVRRPCWISTIMLSFGCQTAVPGTRKGPGTKKENWIERGGCAGGRHESAFGPTSGLTRMLR